MHGNNTKISIKWECKENQLKMAAFNIFIIMIVEKSKYVINLYFL
jgi:hypothetical protein